MAVTSFRSSPDPVARGGNLTYTIEVTNLGEQTAEGAKLHYQQPQVETATFVSASSPDGTFVQENGYVLFDFGDMAVGETATATIVLSPLVEGYFFTSAFATNSRFDPNLSNNFGVDFTNVVESPQGQTPQLPDAPDLVIETLTGTPDPVTVGSPLTYHIEITNRGGNAATGVSLTDVLPDNVMFLSATSSQGGFTREGDQRQRVVGHRRHGRRHHARDGLYRQCVGLEA